MDESEFDSETWISEPAGHAFVRNLLAGSGWDEFTSRRARVDDCEGHLEDFMEAVLDLKAKLERHECFADTEASIFGLTRMFTQPWARFVDPALSMAQTSPQHGSLVVLWECPEHILGLHKREKTRWRLVSGVDEILDLREFLDIDDEELIDATEVEHVAQIPTTEYLSPTDMEYRKLLSKERLERLEQEQEQ